LSGQKQQFFEDLFTTKPATNLLKVLDVTAMQVLILRHANRAGKDPTHEDSSSSFTGSSSSSLTTGSSLSSDDLLIIGGWGSLTMHGMR
jgi:hypothetical protein